jgi:hypothetical protein
MPVLNKIDARDASVRAIHAGTLSAAFIADRHDVCWFIKTHLDLAGQQSLRKESSLLSYLYQGRLSAHCIETSTVNFCRTWLIMNSLKSSGDELSPEYVMQLTLDLSRKLRGFAGTSAIPINDTLGTLLNEAWLALENLSHRELLKKDIQNAVRGHLSRIEREIVGYESVLCHGDLGPKNLMSNGQQTFAIDWEDVFWGVEGYDFLYWLSFYNNRKFYSQKILGKTALGRALEQSIIAMIVLLKSELSFRDGSYRSNSLSFNQRLVEILSLE